MLKICLVFWKSEPQYAYKRYAYKRKNMYFVLFSLVENSQENCSLEIINLLYGVTKGKIFR